MKGWEEAPEGLREKVVEICKKYLDEGSLVLDLGCGYGILSDFLRKEGYNCIGLDIDKGKCKATRKKGVKTICSDLNIGIPIKSSSVDAVVGVEVIEHLENPWNTLREVKRVLKSGGIVILTFPNFTDFISRLKFLLKSEFSFFIKRIPKGGHINILPFWLFDHIIKKTGLRKVKRESHRSWIRRLSEGNIKKKLSLFFLLPLFVLFYVVLRIFREEVNSLLPEVYIFILKKYSNFS